MERALAALVEVLRGYDPDAGVIDAADWVWRGIRSNS